ncbi:PASTA domain-containing protein [Streptomyces sp. NPDC005953]|uniref:PASTA domain-containing protein n=1 Tax=Streptomyces sp. NPDC005953 TaxID=3156719 RepID=UPI0033FD313D
MQKKITVALAFLALLTATACQSPETNVADNTTAGTSSKMPPAVTHSSSATPTPTPTPSSTPTPTATPFIVPSLRGDTQDRVVDLLREHHLRLGLITNRPARKAISLPPGGGFGHWVVCSTDPAAGSRITNSTELFLYLAPTTRACTAPAPKKTYTPPPAPKEPDTTRMRTCSNDGAEPGYACTSNGKVVVEGQFCPKADRGLTLKATNGRMTTCEDYNGWRWNA